MISQIFFWVGTEPAKPYLFCVEAYKTTYNFLTLIDF